MKMKLVLAALVTLGTVTMNPALAAGDAEAGRLKADTCLGCHGVEGYFNVYPTYHVPKVWGQHADYLITALKAYRSGERAHETMQAQAADLSDQDMADIAAFFSAHQSEQADNSGVPQPEGLADKVAQCAGCHGAGGISTNPQWPTLAGQYKDYLARTMRGYRDGRRKNPIMMGQVVGLDDDQVDALAAYFAAHSSSLSDKAAD